MAPPAPAQPEIDEVAAALGLDPAGAEVVRSASRLVMRFPADGVRTFAVPAGTRGPRTEAAVASLLADAGVPSARRVVGPIALDGWSVTAWREIDVAPEAVDSQADAATVGTLAARLHDATCGLDRRGLPACDPIGAARGQLAAAVDIGATPEVEARLLGRHATRLEEVWAASVTEAGDLPAPDVDRTCGPAVLHGDLHPGNVVLGREGPVLVDLELAGWGPRVFDAAPTVALVRWYGRPDTDLTAFDDAYEARLTVEAQRRGLDEVWALWSTAWAVANRHRSPEAGVEALVRLDWWATGASPRPWHLT